MKKNNMKQKVVGLVLMIAALMVGQTAWAATKTVTYKIKAENASGTNRWTLTFERSGDSFGYSTGQKTAIISDLTSTSGFSVVLDDGLGLQLSVTNGSRLAVTNKDGYHGVMLNFQSDQNTYLSVTNLPDGVEVFWASSNEEVATVEENGHVVAVGRGTCYITAVVDDYHESCIVRCNFGD